MNITTDVPTPLGDIITLETRKLISLYIGILIHPPIFLLGLIGNIISTTVFVKIGLKDSISVCFFVISGADLICIVFLITAECSLLLSKFILQQWRVDGDTLSLLIMFYYGPVYDISQGITSFLAVQKCWCVALPFRYKNTFTKTRTGLVVAGISILGIALCVPIFASQGLQETLDQARNTTIFKLTTSFNRAQIMSFRSVMSLVTTTTCQVTVSVCLVILTSSIRASTKFRDTSNNGYLEATPYGTTMINGTPIIQENLKTFANQIISISSGARTINMRTKSMTSEKNKETCISRPIKNTHKKELNAIKSTTFVSVIFVVCTMPKLLFFYAILCEPEFNLLKRYENIYFIANTVRYTFEAFNISCNIFVHLTFNRRFRYTLKDMFQRKSTTSCKVL